jgi:hypothetical protein
MESALQTIQPGDPFKRLRRGKWHIFTLHRLTAPDADISNLVVAGLCQRLERRSFRHQRDTNLPAFALESSERLDLALELAMDSTAPGNPGEGNLPRAPVTAGVFDTVPGGNGTEHE